MCNPEYQRRGFGRAHFFHQHPFTGRNDQFRVPINILKGDDKYEIFVFAPDRAKEDFEVNLTGNELKIAYQLKNETAEKQNWVRHEFQKSSFERSFIIDATVEAENISASYVNGILQLTLPIVPGSEKPVQEIKIA